MPLIVMCGIPGSGKTKRALEIKHALQQQQKAKVVLINQQSLGLTKQKAYSSSQEQKVTRAQLKFQTDKNLNTNTVVIIDSMNYIKGYRYRMFCVAREMKTTYCVVFCNSSIEAARKFNSMNQNRYDEVLFEDLAKRMEVPQLKNRWDVPLFQRREDQPTPVEEIIDVLLFQEKKSKDPISHMSEQKMVGEDYLLELDKTVTTICDDILRQQTQRGAGFPMVFPTSSEKLILNNLWSVIALKKVKNEFLSVIKGKPIPPKQVGNSFCMFIREADKRK